jgi:outer membrane lipoprotein-sorting protein
MTFVAFLFGQYCIRQEVHRRFYNSLQRHILFLLMLGGLPVTMVTGQEQKPDMLTAQEILRRMGTAYATCESYRDSGVVKTVFIGADGKRIVEKPFSTAFVRPNHFRYAYETKESEGEAEVYIIWAEGDRVQTWWDVEPGIQKSKTLSLAVAGATGVSGGSAHTVPAMLLPDKIGGRKLTELNNAKRIEDDKVGKFECFRIQGNHADSPTTLWIDKRTYLLRLIRSDTRFDDFRTEETTSYHATFDGRIADKILEFNPPKRK